jgi:acid phosphatase (class A)
LKTSTLIAFLLFFGLNLSNGFSQEISAAPLNANKLLGPYPARGSFAEALDLNTLLYYQETRTPEQCRLAGLESSASLSNFFGKHHGLLTKKELRWLKIKLLSPLVRTAVRIGLTKRSFKRPRPYLTWPEIKPCIAKESSTAYPSGHATLARVYARLLSKIYPERAERFMARANEAAELRVIGGVHHPSDIEAGKKFGDSVALKILGKKDFKALVSQSHEKNRRD